MSNVYHYASQPPADVEVDPYLLTRGLVVATHYGSVTGEGDAISLSPARNLAGGSDAYFRVNVPTVVTPHGTALLGDGSYVYNGHVGIDDFTAGLTEFTLVAWFAFNPAAQSKQWMNFRNENNMSMDVFSQTSSSITWGSDWRSSWTGGAQKTLSGLSAGDLVCIAYSVRSGEAARQFHNGKFAGTKAGGAFTLVGAGDAFKLLNLAALGANSLGHLAFTQALGDDDLLALTANPWGAFVGRRPRVLFYEAPATPLSNIWVNQGGTPTRSLGLRAWNGTSVVTPTAKRWNGTSWETMQ